MAKNIMANTTTKRNITANSIDIVAGLGLRNRYNISPNMMKFIHLMPFADVFVSWFIEMITPYIEY